MTYIAPPVLNHQPIPTIGTVGQADVFGKAWIQSAKKSQPVPNIIGGAVGAFAGWWLGRWTISPILSVFPALSGSQSAWLPTTGKAMMALGVGYLGYAAVDKWLSEN